MKKFLIQIVIYFSVFLVMVFMLLTINSKYVLNKNFKNSETESNTLIIKENKEYDLLFLGISHARNFSRYGNHEKVEKILTRKIINIGQGSGNCGINEQLYYLDYFYNKGNKVDQVCIVLTPPMLSSKALPIASSTFEKEIFDTKFLYHYLNFSSENKSERIIRYLQSKFSKEWINLKPDKTMGQFEALKKADASKVAEGFKLAYDETANQDQFKKSCNQVEQIIKLAQQHNSDVKLFIPPALFGKWLEHNETIVFLKKMEKKYNCKWADLSESVSLPNLYYDHHHLNTSGVVYFTNQFLKPFINL